ncbi:hypothetical protein OROMI_018848 [Orobanche minor]
MIDLRDKPAFEKLFASEKCYLITRLLVAAYWMSIISSIIARQRTKLQLKDSSQIEWQQAMIAELQTVQKNITYILIGLPPNKYSIEGPVAMAAHKISLQLWRAVSLLTDALVTSSQALIAGYVSKDDYKTVKEMTQLVLKVGCWCFPDSNSWCFTWFYGSIFRKDAQVLGAARNGILNGAVCQLADEMEEKLNQKVQFAR